MPAVTILLAEDNPDDAALTELALRGDIAARLQLARDGQEGLDYLFNDAKTCRGWCCWTCGSRTWTGSKCFGASARTSAHA